MLAILLGLPAVTEVVTLAAAWGNDLFMPIADC